MIYETYSKANERHKNELGENTRNTVKKLCEAILVLKQNALLSSIYPICYITTNVDNIYSGYQVFSTDSENQITFKVFNNLNQDITEDAVVVPCTSPYTFELVAGYDTVNSLTTSEWVPIFKEQKINLLSGQRQDTGVYYATNKSTIHNLVENFVVEIPS